MSEECVTLREKASVLESDLARETGLRSGAEKLANEVQSSLTKETERAEDLKVRITHLGKGSHERRRGLSIQYTAAHLKEKQ